MENEMKKYAIKVCANAYATVVVEAPTPETALDYLTHNFDSYGLDYEVDEMCAEIEAGYRDVQRGGVTVVDEVWGVTAADSDAEADYTVDTEWLENNGYEVVTIIRKRETA
jgi:hypothetical protein